MTKTRYKQTITIEVERCGAMDEGVVEGDAVFFSAPFGTYQVLEAGPVEKIVKEYTSDDLHHLRVQREGFEDVTWTITQQIRLEHGMDIVVLVTDDEEWGFRSFVHSVDYLLFVLNNGAWKVVE